MNRQVFGLHLERPRKGLMCSFVFRKGPLYPRLGGSLQSDEGLCCSEGDFKPETQSLLLVGSAVGIRTMN